jgi:hypothetical protein
LEPFFGGKKEACDAALRDNEQFEVSKVLWYSGDSRSRTKMSFCLEFADGDIKVLPWSPDIQCEAYYKFCEERPHLYHLTLDAAMAKKFIVQKKKEDCVPVNIGEVVFIDLRFFGDEWYEALELPDWRTIVYVMEFQYTHYFYKNSRKKISGKFLLNEHSYSLDAYIVFAWGSVKVIPEGAVLIDHEWARRFPSIVA